MIILCFILVVIFLYGGAIDLPMLARDGTHILIAFIFVGHSVGEWAATDWKDKKGWRSTVNLTAMLALLAAGRLESISHVALAGWLFAECLIHVAKKTEHWWHDWNAVFFVDEAPSGIRFGLSRPASLCGYVCRSQLARHGRPRAVHDRSSTGLHSLDRLLWDRSNNHQARPRGR